MSVNGMDGKAWLQGHAFSVCRIFVTVFLPETSDRMQKIRMLLMIPFMMTMVECAGRALHHGHFMLALLL